MWPPDEAQRWGTRGKEQRSPQRPGQRQARKDRASWRRQLEEPRDRMWLLVTLSVLDMRNTVNASGMASS